MPEPLFTVTLITDLEMSEVPGEKKTKNSRFSLYLKHIFQWGSAADVCQRSQTGLFKNYENEAMSRNGWLENDRDVGSFPEEVCIRIYSQN